MLIAQEKRRDNIAEYILYIWQLEDMLRTLQFDLVKISKELVVSYKVDEDTQLEIYDWYKNLVLMMKKEKITQKGHLQFVVDLVDDLNRFHQVMLQRSIDVQYLNSYQLAKPDIDEFRLKSNAKDDHDIMVGFQALYNLSLLKLQKKEITPETEQVYSHISKLIGHLSARYHQYEDGEFEI